MSIPNKKLSDGRQIPVIGLGTYKAEKPEDLVKAVKAAIQSGYRHFDCAYCYYNEQHVGQAIRESIQESNGALKREDFFVTSKLWLTYASKERVEVGIDEALSKFGFDYLDLFLTHWPMALKEGSEDYPGENGKCIPSGVHFLETYQALEKLVENGKAKSIGVSNFNIQQLKDVLSVCKIRPVCNQVEVNPLFQNSELVEFCHKENIAVVAYAPLGAADRSWLKADDPIPLEHPYILELAQRHNRTPAQIVLRWLIQRDIIPIPKSVTPSRIESNARLFDFSLSDEDMEGFRNNFKNQFRFYVFDFCDNHPNYPF